MDARKPIMDLITLYYTHLVYKTQKDSDFSINIQFAWGAKFILLPRWFFSPAVALALAIAIARLFFRELTRAHAR